MDTPQTTMPMRPEQPVPESQTPKPYTPPAIIYRAPLETLAGLREDYPGKAASEPLCTITNS